MRTIGRSGSGIGIRAVASTFLSRRPFARDISLARDGLLDASDDDRLTADAPISLSRRDCTCASSLGMSAVKIERSWHVGGGATGARKGGEGGLTGTVAGQYTFAVDSTAGRPAGPC